MIADRFLALAINYVRQGAIGATCQCDSAPGKSTRIPECFILNSWKRGRASWCNHDNNHFLTILRLKWLVTITEKKHVATKQMRSGTSSIINIANQCHQNITAIWHTYIFLTSQIAQCCSRLENTMQSDVTNQFWLWLVNARMKISVNCYHSFPPPLSTWPILSAFTSFHL